MSAVEIDRTAAPAQWPANNPEVWPVDRLVPYARNARTHTSEQVAQIAKAMQRWGWTNPVLIGDDGGIIAGHGRIMAADLLGIAEIPVIIARGWSDDEKRAYVIADNKLALNAGWDEALLVPELIAIGELQSFVGFSVDELRALSIGVPEGEFKDLPEGEKGDFTAITFTLHNDQAAIVEEAIETAKAEGPFEGSPNSNSNGNALARICEHYITTQ